MSFFSLRTRRFLPLPPLSALLLAALLSACSSAPKEEAKTVSPSSVASHPQNTPASRTWLGLLRPYKIDIQQGNFVSQEQAAKLQEGMTKDQVRFVLGSPLLTDLFHNERWDYVFRLKKGNGEITTNRLTVFFKEDRVSRIESTPLPDEAAYLSHISGKK
jgi:outer membrane protein assembly factor BamE